MRPIKYPFLPHASFLLRVFMALRVLPVAVRAARVTCYLTVRLSGELWLKPFEVLAVTMGA